MTAFQILAEWAWEKVHLQKLQQQYKRKPTPALSKKLEAAIHSYAKANRQKKKLY